MFVDDMKSARKASLALLMVTIQIVIIITFGGGWTQWTTHNFLYSVWTSPVFSTLVPIPVNGPWWIYLTAIVLYITLAIGFLYIMWTVAQVAVPDRVPFDLKQILLIDMITSGVLTINLLFAYCFFAGGFGGVKTPYVVLGYCFWFAVVGSITSAASMIIAGLSWFRN